MPERPWGIIWWHASHDTDKKAKARALQGHPACWSPKAGLGLRPVRAAVAKEKGGCSSCTCVPCLPPWGPGRLLEKLRSPRPPALHSSGVSLFLPGFSAPFPAPAPRCQPKYWAWPFVVQFAGVWASWPAQTFKAAGMWADLPSGAGATERLGSPRFRSSLLPS